MSLRTAIVTCLSVTSTALALAACATSQSGNADVVAGSGGGGAVAGASGAPGGSNGVAGGLGAGQGGSVVGEAGSASAGAAGSVEPEPEFDATGLSVVGTAGAALCRLSTDGRYLLVSVKNGASGEVGKTEVRVSTDDTAYQLRVRTPTLAASASGDLMFDRGPLVGFVPTWKFTVVIDPDAKHGGPFSELKGECSDLRSRAQAGMVPLGAAYNTASGLWDQDDWWTSANQLETVIDYSRQTGDTKYFSEIDNTFVKNSAQSFDKWGYYDDDGWFAMAWIKAYELTHQQKYLDMAKTIFQRMAGGWDSKCGGGIYWASAKAGDVGLKNKNAIPNELFLQVAARLHLLTPGDTGAGSFLDWAKREWAWFKASGMINADKQIVDGLNNLTDCKATGPIFTYNQGVLVGALVDLAAGANDATALDEANAIAKATIKKMADANGILKEAPCGGDICTQFKGVFMRNLAYLHQKHPLPEYQAYMRKQSDQLWNSNRNAMSQFGYEWHLPFDKTTASRQSSALDALVAAVSSSQMNLALGATASASAGCGNTQTPDLVTDGSSRLDSKWCGGGGGNQTLSLDLGGDRYIVGFRLRHAGAGGEPSAWNTRDFELETSMDNVKWTRAVTVTGNTADITTHNIPGVTARYARLHITSAQTDPEFLAARIYEFEVYGITL